VNPLYSAAVLAVNPPRTPLHELRQDFGRQGGTTINTHIQNDAFNTRKKQKAAASTPVA
jgi:hypothetical protein